MDAQLYVLRSTDNGASWTFVGNQREYVSVTALAVSGKFLVAGGPYRGSVFRSADNCTSWTETPLLSGWNWVNALAVSRTNLFAGTTDGVRRSTDNGASWTLASIGLERRAVYALAVSDTNLFAGTLYQGVFRSTDDGTTWTALMPRATDTDAIALAVSGENIFAGIRGRGVFYSTDNGVSWAGSNIGLTNKNVQALAVSGTTLFAGTSGGVFRSTDNGMHWGDISMGGLEVKSVISLLAVNSTLLAGTDRAGIWRAQLEQSGPASVSPDAPMNGACELPWAAQLRWSKSYLAAYYLVQVGLDSLFSTKVVDESVSGTEFSVSPLTPATTFYWRVRAWNMVGESEWSPTWSFKTRPSSIAVISPSDGGGNLPGRVALTFLDSSRALDYRVEVALNPQFAPAIYDSVLGREEAVWLRALAPHTTYYWRLRGLYVGSVWGPPSPVWHFETGMYVHALLFPVDGAVVRSCDVDLTFTALSDARCEVQVAQDSGFTRPIYSGVDLTDTTVVISVPLEEAIYYWRARVEYFGGIWSAWSPVWHFEQVLTQHPSGTTLTLTGVAFGDRSTGTAVGAGGTILHTTDAGFTWTTQSSGTAKILLGVSFHDVNTGVAVGQLGTILRTTDGGMTWGSQQSGTSDDLRAVSFAGGVNVIAVGTSGTILRSTDGGIAWHHQTSGTTNSLRSVSFGGVDTGLVVGAGGVILRTTDGGVNWQAVSSQTMSNLSGVSLPDAKTGIVVGDRGSILTTTDGGAIWTDQGTWTSTSLFGVCFKNAKDGMAAGEGGTILKTSDGGRSWEAFGCSSTGTLAAVALTDDTVGIVVGRDGAVLRTRGSGTVAAVDEQTPLVPSQCTLSQNYPNPFNPLTTISYTLPKGGYVKLSVHSLLGQEVTTLVNETQGAGYKSVVFDASHLPSGVYTYRITAGTFTNVKKMVLLK